MLDTKDVLSLWEHATQLDTDGKFAEAIFFYKRIMRMGIKNSVRHSSIQSEIEAYGIKNDARLRISQCYADVGDWKKATYWISKHIQHRKNELPSMYTDTEANRIQENIIKGLKSWKRSKQISSCMDNGRLDQARKLIEQELELTPRNPWLLSILSSVYYEKREYGMALKLSRKAWRISPNDPLFIWHYAGASRMNGFVGDALKLYKSIVSMRAYRAGKVETTEGVRWARSLINDSRYKIGLCYRDLGNRQLAKKWIESHLDNRHRGLPSIYCADEVRETLKELKARRVVSKEHA